MLAAAGNQGMAGGIIGVGIGAAVASGLSGGLGQSMAGVANSLNLDPTPNNDNTKKTSIAYSEKLLLLKELAELKNQGILSEEEFMLEKKKVLE